MYYGFASARKFPMKNASLNFRIKSEFIAGAYPLIFRILAAAVWKKSVFHLVKIFIFSTVTWKSDGRNPRCRITAKRLVGQLGFILRHRYYIHKCMRDGRKSACSWENSGVFRANFPAGKIRCLCSLSSSIAAATVHSRYYDFFFSLLSVLYCFARIMDAHCFRNPNSKSVSLTRSRVSCGPLTMDLRRK